ncbi:MAG: hypothetical protein OXC46_07500 [Thaumarchaeota archaeon]|nr:hypothetical protein [Nitrososphaerota archaeon]
MDEALKEKIRQKILETKSNKSEIQEISKQLQGIDDSESFMLGIIVGRIYNSFYYQTRRILGREPTGAEFQEFLDMIKTTDLELW